MATSVIGLLLDDGLPAPGTQAGSPAVSAAPLALSGGLVRGLQAGSRRGADRRRVGEPTEVRVRIHTPASRRAA